MIAYIIVIAGLIYTFREDIAKLFDVSNDKEKESEDKIMAFPSTTTHPDWQFYIDYFIPEDRKSHYSAMYQIVKGVKPTDQILWSWMLANRALCLKEYYKYKDPDDDKKGGTDGGHKHDGEWRHDKDEKEQ